MAKYISVDDFINTTNGKEFDVDHTAGVQCVDAIKEFNVLVYGNADFTCGNGWAYGLWTCYGSNGVEKYFDKFEYSQAKKGDWIIWNKGSKQAPNSHVGMFIERVGNNKVRSYSQNQAGIKAFNFCDVDEDGILGVLRPKIYLQDNFLPPRGWFTKGDSGENVAKIDEFLAEQVQGNYFGDYTESCVKVFQRQNGLEDDGNIGPLTLEKMREKGFTY